MQKYELSELIEDFAENESFYLATEVDARIAGLTAALGCSPCPCPIGDDDTVNACIKAGKCGCDNKWLMVSVTK